LTFIFWLSRPWSRRHWAGLPGFRVTPDQKVAYHKSVLDFDFSGGHFYEKIPNSEIFGVRPANLALWPRYFRPGAKNQNFAPNKLFVSSFRFQKGMTIPLKAKIPWRDRSGRNGRFARASTSHAKFLPFI